MAYSVTSAKTFNDNPFDSDTTIVINCINAQFLMIAALQPAPHRVLSPLRPPKESLDSFGTEMNLSAAFTSRLRSKSRSR